MCGAERTSASCDLEVRGRREIAAKNRRSLSYRQRRSHPALPHPAADGARHHRHLIPAARLSEVLRHESKQRAVAVELKFAVDEIRPPVAAGGDIDQPDHPVDPLAKQDAFAVGGGAVAPELRALPDGRGARTAVVVFAVAVVVMSAGSRSQLEALNLVLFCLFTEQLRSSLAARAACSAL